MNRAVGIWLVFQTVLVSLFTTGQYLLAVIETRGINFVLAIQIFNSCRLLVLSFFPFISEFYFAFMKIPENLVLK